MTTIETSRSNGHDEGAFAPPTPSTTPGMPPLSRGWRAGACALVVGALALAVGGFVNSFSAVRDGVEPSFGELAWTVPVLIDVGVAVFTGIDLLFTRMAMRLRWLRLVPWSLIGATIWLNVADESTSVGVVAHAAPPILWVVTVELAGHAIRTRAGLEAEQTPRRPAGRMDRVPLSRWVLAPWSTLVIRRWMILEQERSYDRAYARWWARKQAKWELQDDHGAFLWRLRAPRQARGFYRYGHLTPSSPPETTPPAQTALAGDVSSAGTGPASTETDNNGARPTTKGGSGTRPAPGRKPANGKQRASFADFTAAAAELTAEGLPVNRTLVTQRLRARGLSLANDRADEYLARLHGDSDRKVA